MFYYSSHDGTYAICKMKTKMKFRRNVCFTAIAFYAVDIYIYIIMYIYLYCTQKVKPKWCILQYITESLNVYLHQGGNLTWLIYLSICIFLKAIKTSGKITINQNISIIRKKVFTFLRKYDTPHLLFKVSHRWNIFYFTLENMREKHTQILYVVPLWFLLPTYKLSFWEVRHERSKKSSWWWVHLLWAFY